MIIPKITTPMLASALLLAGVITPARADEDPAAQQRGLAFETACLGNESCVREIFVDMALGNRFDTETDYFGGVIKWTQPIRLTYRGDGSEIDKAVRATIANIEAVAVDAGLPMVTDDAIVDDQVIDIPIETEVDSNLSDGEICAGRLVREAAGSGRPAEAGIIVSAGHRPSEVSGCVAFYLLRLFGLISTVQVRGFSSLLSEDAYLTDGSVTLTSPMDKTMLSVLYSPLIKPGMTRNQVRAVFPEVYADKGRPPPADIAKTPDLLEPIDQATLNCMADRVCSRDLFMQKAVLGSPLEPKSGDRLILEKKIIPATIRLLVGEQTRPAMREAADRGLHYVMTMADIIGIPYVLADDRAPIYDLSHVILVSPDFEADLDGAFKAYLEAHLLRGVVTAAYELLLQDGVLCAGNTGSVPAPRIGIAGAAAMIPATADMTPWWIERCVIEESMQAFGLSSDTDTDITTLFDDRPDNLRMTAFDLFMYKLLYHPTFEPGMDQELVNALFEDVYQDVWQHMLSDQWWVPDYLRDARELQG